MWRRRCQKVPKGGLTKIESGDGRDLSTGSVKSWLRSHAFGATLRPYKTLSL